MIPHQMVTMLADMMPEEDLIEQLEDAIVEYKTSNDLNKIGFICVLIASKLSIASTKGGAKEMMEDMERMEKTQNLLNPDKS